MHLEAVGTAPRSDPPERRTDPPAPLPGSPERRTRPASAAVRRSERRASRRRGQALEDAILDAAWAEFVERGYGAATLEGVADRAGTSRPVISRRWPTKQELVLATIRHRGARDPVFEPDTGSLREDLLALLTHVNEWRAPVIVVLGTSAGDFLRETGLNVEQIREHWLGDRERIIHRVIGRAVARGEVAPQRVTARTTRLGGDLLRLEVLMRMRPASPEAIRAIVDEIVVPLLTGAPPTGAGG